MSATNVSIRLGVEGKAEIKRAFEEVGQSGQSAFGSVEKAMDRSGAATDREVARLKRLAEAARMAGEADASQKRFNTVLNVDRPIPKSAPDSGGVFEETARDAGNFPAKAEALPAASQPPRPAEARPPPELPQYPHPPQAGPAMQRHEGPAAEASHPRQADRQHQGPVKQPGGQIPNQHPRASHSPTLSAHAFTSA